MEYLIEDNNFYLIENEQKVAKINYDLDNKHLTVNHTIVKKEFRGNGRGKKLVQLFVKKYPLEDYDYTSYCSYFSEQTGVPFEE